MGVAQVNFDSLFYPAVEDDPSLVHDDAPVAKAADGTHIVGDIEHGSAVLLRHVPHFVQALALEGHVAYRQHLVHNHDLAVQVSRHGEGQLDKHAAGIPLDRGIDKVPNLGKVDDGFHFFIDFRLAHAQDGPVHVDILPAGHFAVEAGAHLQHGGNPAV